MAFHECISILIDELDHAIAWERPCILLAVHSSKIGQEKAIKTIEKKMANIQRKVVHYLPGTQQFTVQRMLSQTQTPEASVFFVEGLGNRQETCHALNMQRELLVNGRIKIIFWLTVDEASELPRLAPDFWAFRHRVVEFAPNRGSSKRRLPSGVLLWQIENSFDRISSLEENILFQEKVIRELPQTSEALITRVDMVDRLANLYWLHGDVHKTVELLQQELDQLKGYNLSDVEARLLNGLAIALYDQDNFKEASGFIDQAVRSNPVNVMYVANKGIILHALGRTGDAVRVVKSTIHTASSASRLWGLLGYIHISMGRYDDALASFEEAVRLDTGNLYFLIAMAVCYSADGKMDDFESILRSLDSPAGNSNLHLALCKEGLMRSDSALEHLKFVLESREMTPIFVKRDPSLNLVYDIDKLGLSS